jgi:hypothetical protein
MGLASVAAKLSPDWLVPEPSALVVRTVIDVPAGITIATGAGAGAGAGALAAGAVDSGDGDVAALVPVSLVAGAGAPLVAVAAVVFAADWSLLLLLHPARNDNISKHRKKILLRIRDSPERWRFPRNMEQDSAWNCN